MRSTATLLIGRDARLWILGLLAAAVVIAVAVLPPLAEPPVFRSLADHRTFLGSAAGRLLRPCGEMALDRRGRVQDVEVTQSVPWLVFDQEARRTFQEWIYSHSREDGRTVEARLEFRR